MLQNEASGYLHSYFVPAARKLKGLGHLVGKGGV